MSPSAAVGLLLFLIGGSLGVLFLIARSTSDIPTAGDADLRVGSKTRSKEIGDTVLLAIAVMGLFAALIGLVLLVDAAS
jgi:hypothetical protein